MLTFKPIDKDNIKEVQTYLQEQECRSCDYTVGVLYQWRKHFKTEYAVTDGMMIIRDEEVGDNFYMVPLGKGDLGKAMDEVVTYAQEKGEPACFYVFTEVDLRKVLDHFGKRVDVVEREINWEDYLYEIDQLKTFPGKKMHGQKNHLNRFKKEFPEYKYVKVTQENLAPLEEFLKQYRDMTGMTAKEKIEELDLAREFMQVALDCGLEIGYIETRLGIVAMAAGEVIKDTLYVHVEKALTSVPGAYQAIVSEFAIHASKEDTVYCNREDDSGDEGLRKSKQDYHPCGMIEKYTVTVQ